MRGPREVAEESLTRCIYSLRKYLGADKGFIKTIYGRGYRFTCPVTVEEQTEHVCSACVGSAMGKCWRMGWLLSVLLGGNQALALLLGDARRYDIEPELLQAIADVESGFRADAINHGNRNGTRISA
jgi:soluble lytic murein transglycosylase-like protein